MYTIKSWNHITQQLLLAENNFLFYSITALSKARQFRIWFLVQLVILLPALVYGASAIVAGFLLHYYVIPLSILFALILLATISSAKYVRISNRLEKTEEPSYFFRTFRSLKKPVFSLYVFHIFDSKKFVYVFTKLLSLFVILSSSYLFSAYQSDFRVKAITVLLLAVVHSILVFEDKRFEDRCLSFMRNFPYSRARRFIHFNLAYILILFPRVYLDSIQL